VPNTSPATSHSPPDSPVRGLDPLILAVAAAIVFVSIFPRATAAVFLGALAVIAGAIFAQTGDWKSLRASIGAPLLVTALAIAGWSELTAAWSPAPFASFTKPLYMLVGTIGLAVAAGGLRSIENAALRRVSLGLLLGLLIAGAILALDTVTDQALTKFFYNTFPSLRAGLAKQLTIENGVVEQIKENNINRRATVVTLLLVPALYAALTAHTQRVRWGAALGVAVIAAILMRYSAHQSSQAAIVAAALAFGLARISMRSARILTGAAWCASCLLVVPLVSALHATDIHKNEHGLFFSARHRIVIWNYTAELIKKSPLMGVGADATAAITEARAKQANPEPVEKDGQFVPDAARHAHNAYLQTWYELGAIGAVLLAMLGIAALAAAGSAVLAIQPFLIAEFAAIAGMIAFSFSLWQVWFQGAIGLGVLALLVAQQLSGANARR